MPEYKIFSLTTISNGVTSSPIQKFITATKTDELLIIGDNLKFKLSFNKKTVQGMEVSMIYDAIDSNGQNCFVFFSNDPSKDDMLQYSIAIWYRELNNWYFYHSNPPTSIN